MYSSALVCLPHRLLEFDILINSGVTVFASVGAQKERNLAGWVAEISSDDVAE